MSCISDDLIQKYIDGETTPEEVLLIKKHIANCNKCGVKIENQRRLSSGVKKAINLLGKESLEIPKFAMPAEHIKKHYLNARRLFYMIAAASVLLFVIVITQKKEMKKQNEIIIEISSAMDIDANRPVTQLPLVINFIDAKGNISEYFIK